MSFSPPVALRVLKTGKQGKRVSNSQIPRTGPRTIRGKGRKFGSDTPVYTHGVVFRELWVSLLHPRLGCFSESDLRGWCTGPNETCPPPPPPGHSPLNFDMAVPPLKGFHLIQWFSLSISYIVVHTSHVISFILAFMIWFMFRTLQTK